VQTREFVCYKEGFNLNLTQCGWIDLKIQTQAIKVQNISR